MVNHVNVNMVNVNIHVHIHILIDVNTLPDAESDNVEVERWENGIRVNPEWK